MQVTMTSTPNPLAASRPVVSRATTFQEETFCRLNAFGHHKVEAVLFIFGRATAARQRKRAGGTQTTCPYSAKRRASRTAEALTSVSVRIIRRRSGSSTSCLDPSKMVRPGQGCPKVAAQRRIALNYAFTTSPGVHARQFARRLAGESNPPLSRWA